jgi:hypothetical protein
MCGLCGDLTLQEHWSDRGAGARGRRHHLDRIRAVRALLEGSGLTVADWQGRGYQLGNGRGRTVLVRDLGSLWTEAELLRGGRPVDPLTFDPEQEGPA